MARPKWWPARQAGAGSAKPRRPRRRAKIYLGPEIVLSGDITCCHTVVADGTIESNRIECRKFVLGNAGSFKGKVQAESAVISGRFEGHLAVQGRLVVKAGGRVKGTVQYGQLAIEPGGEVQGDIVLQSASTLSADEELDILDIAVGPKAGRAIGNGVLPSHKPPVSGRNGSSDRVLEITPERHELTHP